MGTCGVAGGAAEAGEGAKVKELQEASASKHILIVESNFISLVSTIEMC